MQSDPALRYLKEGKVLREFCGAYADDLLSAGEHVFQKMECKK